MNQLQVEQDADFYKKEITLNMLGGPGDIERRNKI